MHAGFEVVKIEAVHHFGLTLGWILWEFLCENRPKSDRLFSWISWGLVKFSQLPFLKRKSPKTNNTYYIVVRKNEKGPALYS